jgi:hypothetical protein
MPPESMHFLEKPRLREEVLDPILDVANSGVKIPPGVMMTETQAENILKEMRIIKVCVIVLTVVIVLASAKATFHL